MHQSNFDKKGFFFFLKFTTLIFALFICAKYGPGLVESDFIIVTNGVSQTERQVATLISLKQSSEIKTTDLKQNKTTLGFVGDLMLDRGMKTSVAKYGNGDYIYAFEKVKKYLNSFDILFGNLEGPISDKGVLSGSIYSFRMDPRPARAPHEAGFD